MAGLQFAVGSCSLAVLLRFATTEASSESGEATENKRNKIQGKIHKIKVGSRQRQEAVGMQAGLLTGSRQACRRECHPEQCHSEQCHPELDEGCRRMHRNK